MHTYTVYNITVSLFMWVLVCLRHQRLGGVRRREVEHFCCHGDAVFDQKSERVPGGRSGDLPQQGALLSLS